jgi:hypothetical protein
MFVDQSLNRPSQRMPFLCTMTASRCTETETESDREGYRDRAERQGDGKERERELPMYFGLEYSHDGTQVTVVHTGLDRCKGCREGGVT